MIDAATCLTHILTLPNGKKSLNIFLHSCICETKQFNFPAFHTLTVKQDVQIIIDSFTNYLRCFQIINYVGYCLLTTCFSRLDISHFVKMPSSTKALPKVQELIIKTLSYVYKSDHFKEVEKILEWLLVVQSVDHFDKNLIKKLEVKYLKSQRVIN